MTAQCFTIERIVRPTFKVRSAWPGRVWGNGGWQQGTVEETASFFSEHQAYLWLARRVINWIRDRYVTEDGECRLCGGIGGWRDEDGEIRGCRYHADKSFHQLAERIARALKQRDKRRAEAPKPTDPLTVAIPNRVAQLCRDAEAIAQNARELARLAACEELTVEQVVSAIQRATCQEYEITLDQLLSKEDRTRGMVEARHCAIALSRQLAGASYPYLGKAFDRDHSTTLEACRSMAQRSREDSRLAARMESIRRLAGV